MFSALRVPPRTDKSSSADTVRPDPVKRRQDEDVASPHQGQTCVGLFVFFKHITTNPPHVFSSYMLFSHAGN